jgi:phosphonate transport system ATP-binding protein
MPAAPVRQAPRAPSQSGGAAVVLEVRELRKRFAGETVLDGLSFTVRSGELVAILGANGSGKSTALRCIARLLEPDGGRALVGGRDLAALSGGELREARRRTAMVFQRIHLVGRRTALQNVAAARLFDLRGPRAWSPRLWPDRLYEDAARALQRVGMLALAHRRADTLSGGQAQRVAVARALCQRPSVVLADEPVAALDPRAAKEVMALLRELARTEGIGVVCVLHQPEFARRHADRVLGLADGRLAFDVPPGQLLDDAVERLYDASAADGG